MRVKPDDPEPVRADTGHGSQAAVAVAGEHERERAAAARRVHAIRQAPVQFDHARDLRERRVDRRNALPDHVPALRRQGGPESLIVGQKRGAEPHPDVRLTVVVRPRDERQRHLIRDLDASRHGQVKNVIPAASTKVPAQSPSVFSQARPSTFSPTFS